MVYPHIDRYILRHKPDEWNEELRGKFIKFLDMFFDLLKSMQVRGVSESLLELTKFTSHCRALQGLESQTTPMFPINLCVFTRVLTANASADSRLTHWPTRW